MTAQEHATAKFLKGVTLQTTPGLFGVIPAHGIVVRSGVSPVARKTKDFGPVQVIGLSRGNFSLGHFFCQSGPMFKIGMLCPGDGNSHRVATPSPHATTVSISVELFVTCPTEIVHTGNINILLEFRITISLDHRGVAVNCLFQTPEISIRMSVVAAQTPKFTQGSPARWR